MRNQRGVVVLAALFIGLFAVLAGWLAGRVVKVHRQDEQMINEPIDPAPAH